MTIPKSMIEKAIEGGWKHFDGFDKKEASIFAHNILAISDWHRIALDPTFWQALEKVNGWDKHEFVCPAYNCHQFYTLSDDHEGEIRCPRCNRHGARPDIGEYFGEYFCHLILSNAPKEEIQRFWEEVIK